MSTGTLRHVAPQDGRRAAFVAPDRSYVQRMEALERANGVRSYRSDLKRKAKRREVDLLGVLAVPPAEVDSMKVFDLLVAMPKIGRVKANRVLARAKVSPSKTVGGLSDRQRRELLAFLRRGPAAIPARRPTRPPRPAPPPRFYVRCRRCCAKLLVPTTGGLCRLCQGEPWRS